MRIVNNTFSNKYIQVYPIGFPEYQTGNNFIYQGGTEHFLSYGRKVICKTMSFKSSFKTP